MDVCHFSARRIFEGKRERVKELKFLGFHNVVASYCENFSIHVPITTVGLILTKLGYFGKSQNSILTFFVKKIKF